MPAPATDTITDTARITRPSDDDADLALGYRLGYGTGYEIGWSHGWSARDDELQAALGITRAALSAPRYAELDRAREHRPGEFCATRCGRCSRCVHAATFWRRGGRDYRPGDRA
jgi:hypothetical protein